VANSSLDVLIIAVDGPSGSGKSSASRGVASALGLRYLDTGAMYRALTWWMMTQGVDSADEAAITARVTEPTVEVSTDPLDQWVLLDSHDVSAQIRTRGVSAEVSAVARIHQVRTRLIAAQRAIIAAARPGIVAEGRDIGTVVAPAAQLKVFLTAASRARAERRAPEVGATVDLTESDQARRDRLDAAQSAMAEDAVLIDSTNLTLSEVIETIARLARERTQLACAGGKSS
jgi:cytidylate kinase